MGSIGRVLRSSWGGAVNVETSTHRPIESVDKVLESSPFGVFVASIRSTSGVPQMKVRPDDPGALIYQGRRGGLVFGGTWREVAAQVSASASTSSQGSLISGIDGDPHPKPEAATRVRDLKERSGLTWDQLRRLFGVSRRALHAWATGARMNASNEERLALLEQVVARVGSQSPGQCRDMLLRPSADGGRSLFQRLVLNELTPNGIDVVTLTESTGEGRTYHDEFLFAEATDNIGPQAP